MMVTIAVLIVMMVVEIVINGGIENMNLNPMAGPSAITLLHLGGKHVPCMRPNPNIPSTTIVPCYPGYNGPTVNGQCYYYDNLQFLCGGDTFNPHNYPNQGWRFITPLFLHVGFIHLVLNLLMVIRTGIPLEKLIGSARMFLLYMLSGLGGNLLSALLAPKNGNNLIFFHFHSLIF